MGPIKAKLRAEVLRSIDTTSEIDTDNMRKKGVQPPKVCDENLMINELFREYLAFNHYRETLSVFEPGNNEDTILVSSPIKTLSNVLLKLSSSFKIIHRE